MKKITLFIALIAFTFGFSQTFPIDFSTAEDTFLGDGGCAFALVANPDDAADQVGQITANGGQYENLQLELDTYLDLTTANKTITFDFYSTTTVPGLVKLESTLNGNNPVEMSFSPSGLGWETITLDFSTATHSWPNTADPLVLDQYAKFVIFPDFGVTSTGTYYVDDIAGAANGATTTPPLTTFNLDFETATNVAGYEGLVYTDLTDNDVTTGLNTSAKVGKLESVNAAPWCHIQVPISPSTFDLSAGDKGFSIMYKGNRSVTVKFKLEGSGSTEVDATYSSVGEWEKLLFNFSSSTSTGFNKIILFTDPGSNTPSTDPADDVFMIDNLVFDTWTNLGGEVVASAPTTNAPTPTVDASDVISIYSDAYTDIAGTNFNPGWGQSTVVNTAYDPTGEGTNTVIEYSNFNYQGTEFTSTDMSAMTKVHFDVWTANEATIQFTPISPGQENLVSVTSTGGTWTSIDLDLASNFSNVVLSDIFQLKFVGSGTVYLDNIYFYSTPPTTTVTVDVSELPGGVNIQSNQNGWAEAAAVDNGDGTYSYTFENVAAGTVIEYKWILYASATPTFEDLIPLVGGGGVDNDLAANLPTNETILTDYTNYCNRTITASTTDVVAQTYFFNSFRQPGVDYPELVVTAPAGENLVIDYSSNGWSEFHGPGAVDNGDGTHTVLVDPSSAFEYKWVNTTTGVTEDLLACDNSDANINTDNSTYANRVHAAGEDHNDVFGTCPLPEGPTTSAPTPPTRDASDVFSLLSDAYTNQTAGVNAFAGASIEDFVIGGTDNTLKVTAPTAGGGYQYVFGIPNGVDLSAFTHMHIDYYAIGEVVGGEVLQTFLQQFAGDGAFQHNIINTAAVTTTASWVSIDVEISTMGSGELSRDNIGQIQMVLAGPAYGPVFLDNIYFYREATQGLDDNVFNTVKMFPNPAKDTVQFSVNSNENLDIEIFDMLGKSVLRVNDVQNEVNISDLNSGLYFVQMTLGTQQATKKLIVN